MMSKSLRFGLVLFTFATVLTGCLKTRSDVKDVEQRQVVQQQVVSMQRNTADANSRFSDVEEQLRYLTGRVEVVENKVTSGGSGQENAIRTLQQQNNDQAQKISILQDALSKMETQVNQLNAELQGVRAEHAAEQAEKTTRAATKDSFEAGENFFAKKDWKKAILNYQRYRDENPKGKNFAEATYKIGVCFQELGLKDEAKTFYDEVVSKFSKSEQARKARTRLKGLKK